MVDVRRTGSTRSALWLLLLLPIGAIAALAISAFVPLDRSLAQARWAQQSPQHYQIKVRWREGGWVAYSLLEVRDGRLAQGIDLFTGLPLSTVQLGVMAGMFPVEQTFAQIALLQRWPSSWRAGLARSMPFVAARRVIDPCAAALPAVRYDQQRGYPTEIHENPNPCFNGVGYDVTVEELHILP